ncbi:MAG: hypothetical protein ACN0LA_12355 [Candidatus Longimicrobiales bacterium M2_2A_002]
MTARSTRIAFLGLALSLPAVFLPAPLAAQRPVCAEALAEGEVAERDSAGLLVGDLTLDGATDAAYWWADSAQVVLVIGACDGGEVAKRWRLVVDLPADCPAAEARVELTTLLLDEALVGRACAGEESASECAHLRRENERRRALMAAGGRALRVGGPACTVETLRWSPDMGAFMRIPG